MSLDPRQTQRLARTVLWAMTILTVAVLLFIITFILRKGLPALSLDFLTRNPVDMGKGGGIFSTIVGTVVLTAVAVLIATPLGVGTAIFLTEYTWENAVTRVIRFGADCLAGIPSIIFGLFGFILFVTKLGFGWSILSGGLTLAFMILPTIIRTSEEAIKSVPPVYRTVSFSLGGTKWQTVTRVVLPSAVPGIVTGIILSIGRSIGETAAVIFTAGSALRLPTSLLSSSRTMSVHFYILAREGISMPRAYGTAAVLIIAILIINIATYYLMNRFIKNYS
jgi:phosphate transport system permease protein